MTCALRPLVGAVLLVASAAVASAAPAATLFRLFLTDGTTLVSYGEFVRIDDRVIFSMPVGGPSDHPRLHVVTVAAASIDWGRTEQYAMSARALRYAETRGEEEFQLLTSQVARVLNDIALTTDRPRALAIATEARKALAEWPLTHFGYRQHDVQEIVSLIDEAIASLRPSVPGNTFELAFVAAAPTITLEPVRGMPTALEQLGQVFRLLPEIERAADRIALLHAGVALLDDAASTIDRADAAVYRDRLEQQIQQEVRIDRDYARVSQRLVAAAAKAASNARIADVERVLDRIAREDGRLGRQRPETVHALTETVRAHLEAARTLQLQRDQWVVRRASYRLYQRRVGSELLQLAKAQPLLEAIRRLSGPPPDRLMSLRSRLSGGAERLTRFQAPEELRAVHDLVISAWRFAENAANVRYQAVSAANVTTAWEASSAAAGALMLFSRAQQELRMMLQPPVVGRSGDSAR